MSMRHRRKGLRLRPLLRFLDLAFTYGVLAIVGLSAVASAIIAYGS